MKIKGETVQTVRIRDAAMVCVDSKSSIFTSYRHANNLELYGTKVLDSIIISIKTWQLKISRTQLNQSK